MLRMSVLFCMFSTMCLTNFVAASFACWPCKFPGISISLRRSLVSVHSSR